MKKLPLLMALSIAVLGTVVPGVSAGADPGADLGKTQKALARQTAENKKAAIPAIKRAMKAASETVEQLMTDSGSAKLAQRLEGHTLLCGPVDELAAATEEKGFFPVSVQATPKGPGKTLLRIATADPAVGFGYGGGDADPVVVTGEWIILGVGDDGRRHLFLNMSRFDRYSEDMKCDRDRRGNLDGQIPGVVSEIWDAGTITSRGVQCCFK